MRSPSPSRTGRRPLALLAAAALAAAGSGPAAGQGPPPTPAAPAPGPITATAGKKAKQIRVAADDPAVRAAFSHFADGLQAEVAILFGESPDDWAFPIDLRVTGSPKDVVEGRTAAIPPIELLPDGRFLLQLAVRLHHRYDQAEVRRETLRLLLYERMLRPHAANPAGFSGQALVVPPWLLRGLDELLKHRASGRPSDLYAGILRSREILSVSRILSQEEAAPDPVTDAIFAASSAALLSALLDQEDGEASMRAFLGSLAGTEAGGADADGLLRAHFPGLRGSPAALEKWWSLEIATMGQLQAVEFYPLAQTEQLLDEALAIQLAAEVVEAPGGLRRFLPHAAPDGAFTGRVHDFERFLSHQGARAALEASQLKLKSLGLRGFPLLRSLILRYERAVARLLEGKGRGVAADLRKLDEERAVIRQTMDRVTDYLNFYEATQAEGRSEAYEHYREIKEQLERRGPPARQDRLSRYLDALEAEFSPP